ncbi:hypothetical protein [Rufibacter quisquiliarum]|uniref:Lipoprotein n=1 Tax=Rufibacter quisquiliarum TaxID=1549639 RepID=A0A839GKE6_9BACT|nr:hypothetical protein [Rufibacter quisquiliarum]MBA9076065.1 hypothetical protein [Rufibacter quisquiliarum]
MRKLLYLLLAMCLLFGCKTAQNQNTAPPVSGLFSGKQAENASGKNSPENFPDSVSAKTGQKQTEGKKPGLLQRIFGPKSATVPRKCKNCYIVNVTADNGAAATVPVSQGDAEIRAKNGTAVAPQTQNVAPGGSINAPQELVATTENKRPFPWWLFLLPLILLLVYLARRYL